MTEKIRREASLVAYRSEQSHRAFAEVYACYRPWIRTVSSWALGRYRSLDGADLPDVENEGLLAISRASLRFVYVCPTCGRAFLRASRLRAHGRGVHGVLGALPRVSLLSFVDTTARLAMRRAAGRLAAGREEQLADFDGAVPSPEDAVLFEYLVRSASVNLSRDSLRALRRILDGGRVSSERVLVELRECFFDLRA